MLYSHPVPLHDDTTLASFNTSFTFKILDNSSSMYMPGDGMAFFLTSFPSRMPPLNTSGGELLGLVSVDAAPSGQDQFVAVEFDTYTNSDNGDPSGNHIGIDINSVRSLNTTSLPLGQNLSGSMTAMIKFDNITQTLVASLELIDSSYQEPIVITYQLPDLRTLLPREVAVGFSASTGVSAERHQILTGSFNSTRAPTTPPKGQNNKIALMVIGGAVGLVLLVVVAWLILSYCKWWTNRHRGIENQGNQQGPTRFAYQDLVDATDNFLQEKKLGHGSFGVVYKGYLKKLGRDVAVKEILNKSNNSDFYAELNAITSVKHKNLVKLVGWCKGGSCNFVEFMCWCWKNPNNKLFLVYELMPNGNLEDHLHNKVEPLPWETRYKIVKNITCALLYLHHECDTFVLHRDIKPSNILLDDNFNAKLADFGLSRIAEDNSSKVLTIPVGSNDYPDPQLKKPQGKVEFDRSSDVYTFGIVLLEIACGKQGSMLLREQVWQLYINRSLLQAADDKLKGEFNISEMESVLILGLWCSYFHSKMRPSMEQVMAVLEHGKQLPDLNSLDTSTSVSTQIMELETYIDSQAHLPLLAAPPTNNNDKHL